MGGKSKKIDKTKIFPWKSQNAKGIKKIFSFDWNWTCALIGGDQLERELLITALSEENSPVGVFDFLESPAKGLQEAVFGSYSFTSTENKLITPGLSSSLDQGILIIENTDLMPKKTQLVLPSILDSKSGRQYGPYEYEEIPINFKIVFSFDEKLPPDFENRLFYRFGLTHRLSPLSERPEDLVPVLKYAIQKIEELSYRLDIEDTFWANLSSKAWPFSLGQWIHSITNFFMKNPGQKMTWIALMSSLDIDLDEIVTKYNILKQKQTLQARSFLANNISGAQSTESLMRLSGLSWAKIMEEIERLGLGNDRYISEKIKDFSSTHNEENKL